MAALKLTKKLAVQLLKENFPVPVKDLKLDESMSGYIGGYQRYSTMVGKVEVSVENDFYEHSGHYAIVICAGLCAQKMWMLFDSDTLKRDYRAEDWFYRDMESVKRQEIIEREKERQEEAEKRFKEAKVRWRMAHPEEVA